MAGGLPRAVLDGRHQRDAGTALPAANASAALAWSLTIGLGAYVAGPSIAEAAADLGAVGLVALVLLAVLSAAAGRRLRHD